MNNLEGEEIFKLRRGVKTSVVDPVQFFHIRIRVSGFKNSDPDPGDPKRPDSDRI